MRVLQTLEEKCDPSLACLLVVDVQNDYCHPKGSAGKAGNDTSAAVEMVPRLARLLEEARQVALPVIFIQTIHSEWTDAPSWIYRKPAGVNRTTCRAGSWGAEFYEGIAPLPDEKVVVKHRYSAFINTDLNTVLRAKGVESVLVTGVATEVCVETTTRDALMYDYYVTLIKDCAASYHPHLHDTTLENIERMFGVVASSEEIIRVWQQTQGKSAAAL